MVDIERFRAIIRESGSLQAAKDKALAFIAQGKHALVEIKTVPLEAREFLEGIADYMEKRDY